MSTLLTRPQLAAKIKAKYPDYADMDDFELVNKVVAKHPEYGDLLDPAESSVVQAADVVDLPQEPSSKFPPPPTNAPSIGPGKKLAPDPSTTPESLDRLLEAIGLHTPDPNRPGLSRTLAEEPLNESDFAALGRGLVNTAATAASPFAMGAAAGAGALKTAGALAGGGVGSFGGEMVGRSMGEQGGVPEVGSFVGETAGGLLGGGVGSKASKDLAKLPPRLSAAVSNVKINPAAAKVLRGGIGTISPRLRSAVELGEGALELLGKGSGTKAAPISRGISKAKEVFTPPPSLEGTLEKSITATKAGKATKMPSSTPKHTVEEAVTMLKAAKTPQERGALIRELAGKGHDKTSRGQALSTATNKPLDIDDLSEAKDFLKQAGSLDKALEIIRNHPENSVQDVIKLSRAVREASRAK